MYHSVTFGDKNTWDDWHLVPTSRPLFNPPSPKTKTVEIPGADGILDISESLSGRPTFNNREGSMEFYVMNGYQSWATLYSEILEYLHGRRMKAILEDDPAYYYIGRFSVNQWKSDKDWSKITIDYNVSPYKKRLESSTSDENWLWDPFNFETGIILSMICKEVSVTSGEVKTLTSKEYGVEPITPSITIHSVSDGSSMEIEFKNPTFGITVTKTIKAGETVTDPEIIFYGDQVTFTFKNSGTVSIDFTPGRL